MRKVKVAEIISKIKACEATADKLADMAEGSSPATVYYDAEELLREYADLLRKMEVKAI